MLGLQVMNVALVLLDLNELALSELANLDENLVRHVFVDFAALQLQTYSSLVLDAEARLFLELEMLLVLEEMLMLLHRHEDSGDQCEDNQ